MLGLGIPVGSDGGYGGVQDDRPVLPFALHSGGKLTGSSTIEANTLMIESDTQSQSFLDSSLVLLLCSCRANIDNKQAACGDPSCCKYQ
jgi:hypothetical protein